MMSQEHFVLSQWQKSVIYACDLLPLYMQVHFNQIWQLPSLKRVVLLIKILIETIWFLVWNTLWDFTGDQKNNEFHFIKWKCRILGRATSDALNIMQKKSGRYNNSKLNSQLPKEYKKLVSEMIDLYMLYICCRYLQTNKCLWAS